MRLKLAMVSCLAGVSLNIRMGSGVIALLQKEERGVLGIGSNSDGMSLQ